jgi:hypothetical protein
MNDYFHPSICQLFFLDSIFGSLHLLFKSLIARQQLTRNVCNNYIHSILSLFYL